MRSSENLQATKFIDSSMSIVAHRVVHLHRKLIAVFWREKRFFSLSNDGNMF
jgi:hypothetical protein